MGNAPLKWKEIKNASGTQPKSRHGHRAVCIKELMIIFGGGNEGIINGLHVFNTFSNQWYSPTTKGDVPPGRASFGMEVVGTRIVVFGGMLEYGEYTDESYELQTTKWEWKAIKPKPTIENLTPCPRIGHSFTLIDDKIYLFGGLTNLSYDPRRNEPRILNDLYTLSVQSGKYVWEMPTTFGNTPTPRESHTTVAFHSKITDKKYLVMYGGMDGDNRLGEVYTLDTDTMFWTEYKDIPGPTPLPRSLHSATRIGNKLYIFGGWVPFTKDKIEMKKEQIWECTNTCACLNLETFTWENINPKSLKGERPRGRAGHCAVGIYGRICLFSGRDGYRKAWNNQVRICCKDLWYIEVEPPEASPKLNLVRVTTQSFELGWNSIPNAQHYLIEVQKIPEPTVIPSLDGDKEKMIQETDLHQILKPLPSENDVTNIEKSPIKVESKITTKPDPIENEFPEEDGMDIEQQIDELNQKRAETRSSIEIDENSFKRVLNILSPPRTSVNQTNSTENPQKLLSPPPSLVNHTVMVAQNKEMISIPTKIAEKQEKAPVILSPPKPIIKLDPNSGLLSIPKSTAVIHPSKVVTSQKPVVLQQSTVTVASSTANRPIFVTGNQQPRIVRLVNPSSVNNTVVMKNPSPGLRAPILFKTTGGQLTFQRFPSPSGNQAVTATSSQIVRPVVSSNVQPTTITIGGKTLTLIRSDMAQMRNVKIVKSGSISSNPIQMTVKQQTFEATKNNMLRNVIIGHPMPAAESRPKIIMMPQRVAPPIQIKPEPIPQIQTQKQEEDAMDMDSDEYEVEWIDQMDGAFDGVPDDEKKLLGGTRVKSNGTDVNDIDTVKIDPQEAQNYDIEKQIAGVTINKNDLIAEIENDGDSSSTDSGTEFESKSKSLVSKSQAQQERSAIEDNPLDTLASAAIGISPMKEPKKDVKKEDEWMTVGIFKTLQHNVTSYIDYNDWNSNVINLDSNNIPDLSEFKRIALEPGQTYRFRICGINSCGRGEFSEPAIFKTSLPGLPGAPSATKIVKTADGAHLSWEAPTNPRGEILEYSVYLAVKSKDSYATASPMSFIRVYCGPASECDISNVSIAKAHVDMTGKPAIIFRLTARNENGTGPATQVRWLQDVNATKVGESTTKRPNDKFSDQKVKRLKGGKP